ncbi:MAG: hypothetical protein RLY78_2750 [Pseudomonadota bacterium]
MPDVSLPAAAGTSRAPAAAEVAAAAAAPRRLPAWTREPLLHFLLAGAALFGADRWLNPPADDPHTLVIDAAVDEQARRVFHEARGRAPDADELYALRRVWLDNEVLYREGLALRLDQGDKAIQDRVVFKMLSTIEAGLKPPQADDATLRRWFEQQRVSRYDEPARVDFDEAVLPPDETGEAAARALAERLNTGGGGDTGAGLRVYKARPLHTVAQSWGEAFARELATLAPGTWQAVGAGSRWQVVRVNALAAARPARFEDVAHAVRQDWIDATMAEQRAAAVREMARKYRVRTLAGAPVDPSTGATSASTATAVTAAPAPPPATPGGAAR